MRYVVARGAVATQDAALVSVIGTANGLAVTNKAVTAGVATLTVPGHAFTAGEQVTVVGVDATFNGTVTLTGVSAGTTISYTILPPDIASASASGTATGSVTVNVTNKALTTNVATLTVPGHAFTVTEVVVIAGVDATFNGTRTITAVTSTTISYALTHADVTSAAATGTATGSVATTVTNKALTAGVATLTVPGHGFLVSEVVTVAGVDAALNGTPTLTAVTSTTISYAVLHTDVVSAAAVGSVSAVPVNLVLSLTAGEDGAYTRAWSVADPEPLGGYTLVSTVPMLSEAFSQAIGGSVFWTLDQATQHARYVSQGG